MASDVEVCHLFRELQDIYQFSGMLAKFLTQHEPGYYITGAYEYNEVGWYGLDIGLIVLGDLVGHCSLEHHAY